MFSSQLVQEQQLVFMRDHKATLVFMLMVQKTVFAIFDLWVRFNFESNASFL